MTDDTESMAALWVNDDEGAIELHPDWEGNRRSGYPRWSRLRAPVPIAAGILRLMRERDEAREIAVTYAPLRAHLPWAPVTVKE